VVPVIAPVSLGPDGSYNVNADEAAGAVAAAMATANRDMRVEVTFVTNVAGVRIGDAWMPELTAQAIEQAIASGDIYGGMIPKVQAALTVLAAGAAQARIVNMDGLEALARGQDAGTCIRTGGVQ
jgi:acetylglutamate kinase